MWQCFGSGFGHGGGFMGGGFVGLLFMLLVVVLVIFLFVKLVQGLNSTKSRMTDKDDSMEILKNRYARGEISDEEFQRMKRMLL